ncbi:MAG: endonuclease/exonuclease/phosphatase family protein [Bacteroidota bacterium]
MKVFIDKILKLFNYILGGALLLAYVSVYISPEFFWPMAFLGLAFPFLLIANILFCIYWIVNKKRFFLLSLIILLIGLKPISLSYQMSFSGKDNMQTPQSKKEISILSYNVRLFNLFGKSEFGDSQKELFTLIRKNNPDIVCFQEFYISGRKRFNLDSIGRQLPDLSYSHIFWLSRDSNYKYGIATFSKYPIVKKGHIDFGKSLNASIFTDILIDKERIRIYNNHLQSIRFDNNNYQFISNQSRYSDHRRFKEIQDISYRLKDAFIKRSKQAEKISASINKSAYPVIVCGDFNDTPVSYTYNTISSGLNDAFVEAGSGVGITYKGKFPSYRIDYILYDDAFEINGFDILRKSLSDHYPVKASVRIKN